MDNPLDQNNCKYVFYDYLNHKKTIFKKIYEELNTLNCKDHNNYWKMYYKIYDEQFKLYDQYLEEQQEKDNIIINSRNIQTQNKIKELLYNLKNIVLNEYYKYPYCEDCKQCSNKNIIRDKYIESLEEILTETEKIKLFRDGCSTCNLPLLYSA